MPASTTAATACSPASRWSQALRERRRRAGAPAGGRGLHQRGRRALPARHAGLAGIRGRTRPGCRARGRRRRRHRARRRAGTHRLCGRSRAGLHAAVRLSGTAHRAGAGAGARGDPIGAVENLQGISWQRITIEGDANHAGTTPMRMRRDAGHAAARVVTFLRDHAAASNAPTVATVGSIALRAERHQRHPVARDAHRRSARSRRGAPARRRGGARGVSGKLAAAEERRRSRPSGWRGSSRSCSTQGIVAMVEAAARRARLHVAAHDVGRRSRRADDGAHRAGRHDLRAEHRRHQPQPEGVHGGRRPDRRRQRAARCGDAARGAPDEPTAACATSCGRSRACGPSGRHRPANSMSVMPRSRRVAASTALSSRTVSRCARQARNRFTRPRTAPTGRDWTSGQPASGASASCQPSCGETEGHPSGP